MKRCEITFLRWTGSILKMEEKETVQGQKYPACKILFTFYRFLLFESHICFKNNLEISKYDLKSWQRFQYNHFNDNLLLWDNIYFLPACFPFSPSLFIS